MFITTKCGSLVFAASPQFGAKRNASDEHTDTNMLKAMRCQKILSLVSAKSELNTSFTELRPLYIVNFTLEKPERGCRIIVTDLMQQEYGHFQSFETIWQAEKQARTINLVFLNCKPAPVSLPLSTNVFFTDPETRFNMQEERKSRSGLFLLKSYPPVLRSKHTKVESSQSWAKVLYNKRHIHPPPTPVNIQGMDIHTVKYLGVHLNNKLDWTYNANALYNKGQSRLYLLHRLRSFGVQGPLLMTFYDWVVAPSMDWSAGAAVFLQGREKSWTNWF